MCLLRLELMVINMLHPENIFQGKMDDVGIFNEALTSQEIQDIMNGVAEASEEATCVAYYSFLSSETYDACTAELTNEYSILNVINDESAYLNSSSEIVGSNISPVTIAAWISLSSIGTEQFILDDSNNDVYGGGLSLKVTEDGKLSFVSRDEEYSTISQQALEVGKWYFVGATFDGDKNRVYIDGELAGEYTVYAQRSLDAGAMTIGASLLDGGYFDGRIDDVAIFSGALSSAELAEIMENGVDDEHVILARYYDFNDEFESTGDVFIEDGSGSGTFAQVENVLYDNGMTLLDLAANGNDAIFEGVETIINGIEDPGIIPPIVANVYSSVAFDGESDYLDFGSDGLVLTDAMEFDGEEDYINSGIRDNSTLALEFDGVDDYIDMGKIRPVSMGMSIGGENRGIDLGENAFTRSEMEVGTISGWFKRDVWLTGEFNLFDCEGLIVTNLIYDNGKRVLAGNVYDGAMKTVIGTTNIEADKWYHFAQTWGWGIFENIS